MFGLVDAQDGGVSHAEAPLEVGARREFARRSSKRRQIYLRSSYFLVPCSMFAFSRGKSFEPRRGMVL
jgi:hypothetical protein